VQTTEDSTTHRPLGYTTYDNLDQAVTEEQYDGDGVTPTDADNDGVPDQPDASLMRARTTNEFDDQGRVFRTHVFGVDPSDGTVSTNSLSTNYYFDHRGQVI